MTDALVLWPVVCCGCRERYAAFRVYARWGRARSEYPTCAECGPDLPAWVEGRFDEVYHTVLRPVPEVYDPVRNPYQVAVKESAV